MILIALLCILIGIYIIRHSYIEQLDNNDNNDNDNDNDNDNIYNYKVSSVFSKMFSQPTIWLSYSDFDGSENVQKLFINNFKLPNNTPK